jgi:hypothetical protein
MIVLSLFLMTSRFFDALLLAISYLYHDCFCMNSRFELDFQIHQFISSNHKFDNLIIQTIRDYLVEFIRDISLISASAIESRTRSEKFEDKSNTSQFVWSQNWAIDKSEFRKVVIRVEKNANLLSSFITKHSRQSFKAIITNITSSVSAFASSTLQLSETLSSLDLINQFSIAYRILKEKFRTRSFSSSSLTSIFSDFESISNARFFINFDFRSRSYKSFNRDSNSIFSISKHFTSNFTRSKSILDFIENSKSIQTVVSKLSFFENSDEQVAQFVIEQKILENIAKLKELTITSTRNISLIFQNVFSQSIVNESINAFAEQSFVDMTFNSRNAEFEADNIDQDESSSFN